MPGNRLQKSIGSFFRTRSLLCGISRKNSRIRSYCILIPLPDGRISDAIKQKMIILTYLRDVKRRNRSATAVNVFLHFITAVDKINANPKNNTVQSEVKCPYTTKVHLKQEKRERVGNIMNYQSYKDNYV